MKQVVLIGTSHKYQLPANRSADGFRAFIERVCVTRHIRAIAEEMSQEALDQKRTAQSVCWEIANAFGVLHLYCDPNNEKRIIIGIRNKSEIELEGFYKDWSPKKIEQEVRVSHSLRERHWLEHIVQLDCWPTLFVCGACHVDSFRCLAEAHELFVELAASDWKPD